MIDHVRRKEIEILANRLMEVETIAPPSAAYIFVVGQEGLQRPNVRRATAVCSVRVNDPRDQLKLAAQAPPTT